MNDFITKHTARKLSLMGMAIAGYIAIAGVHLNSNMLELLPVVASFIGGASYIKLKQKSMEKSG